MAKSGYVSKLIGLIMNPACQSTVLGLLYHISLDDRYKADFAYTDAVPTVIPFRQTVTYC